MPTYDYICDECRHEFEAFESIKADPRKDCPACGKSSLRRKIGPGAAILFKGSGFYQTDYRSESYKKAAQADKPSEGAAKNSGSGDSTSTTPTPTATTGGSSTTPSPTPSATS
ncbi:MAG: FmdB family zinc ribbon protein [Isosphaeraceae bacterium]